MKPLAESKLPATQYPQVSAESIYLTTFACLKSLCQLHREMKQSSRSYLGSNGILTLCAYSNPVTDLDGSILVLLATELQNHCPLPTSSPPAHTSNHSPKNNSTKAVTCEQPESNVFSVGSFSLIPSISNSIQFKTSTIT